MFKQPTSQHYYTIHVQVSDDNSLEFTVIHGTKHYCLNLSPLSNPIVSATFKKKADKFVITMKKKDEVTWDKLKK